MEQVFIRSMQLADLFFSAVEKPTFVSFIQADQTGRNPKAELNRWVGGVNATSKATVLGPWKGYSLLGLGETSGITRTPIPGFEHSCPYTGGFREDDLIAACSGWQNGRVDLMFAALLKWSMKQEIRLHHVGYRHITTQNRDRAIAKAEQKYGSEALFRPVTGDEAHERYFIKVRDRRAQNKWYWEEHQLWPNNRTPGLHFDFATGNPEAMVAAIALIAGLQHETWEQTQYGPCSYVAEMNLDGVEIEIMGRPRWSEVDNWPGN